VSGRFLMSGDLQRTVCWFSAGAASAVATKLMLVTTENVVIAYTDPGSEHPDNQRFIRDCEEWFGQEVVQLKSARYADTWQVWTERRYLNGPAGVLCSVELKKKLRQAFQRPDDRQVFGYTAEEAARADRFRANNVEVDLVTPLIERGLTKPDCLALIDRAGIVLPAMYRLGYKNANCVGCPQGGIGYWNKIRRDFPDTFARMAAVERDLDATCLRDDGPLFLDELDPGRGSHDDEPDFECSLLCAIAESDLGGS
jgi:hypothetical protein